MKGKPARHAFMGALRIIHHILWQHRFEYLLALIYADLHQKSEGGPIWGPIGCFGWRGRGAFRLDDPPIMKEIESEVAKVGEHWPLLTAGLFDSSVERFQAIKTAFDAWVRSLH